MLSQERYKKILDLIKENGSVYVADLSKRYEVSEETIRRDLDKLEKEGLLFRIHGGAISFNHTRLEPSYNAKINVNVDEKRAIAAEAANLVEEGDSIILDSSTTVLFLAKELKNKRNITIVTNFPLVINEFTDVPAINIISTGGALNRPSCSLVGSITENFLKEIHVDKTFISTKAVSIEEGLTEGDIANIAVKKCMIHAAKQNILLADSSKFNHVAFAQVVPLSAIDIIITDNGIEPEYLKQIKENNLKVILVETNR
ncbi:MAG: DeoR/GlpR family DNA-binding transcription regulator [Actinobacteria bacterium]|nr:DeoR/GlpR family DNA-binding transcription regulator [Actinomycetota bacterium]